MENRNLGAVARRSKLVPLPDGTHVELRALVLSDLACLQEEAAHAFKRDLIETYTRNADLLPEADRRQVILDAFKRAEEIRPDTIEVDKANAWVDKTLRGQMTTVWLSMRGARPDLTFDQAAQLYDAARDAALLEATAEAVQEISKPTLGNGRPPQPTTEAGAKEQIPTASLA